MAKYVRNRHRLSLCVNCCARQGEKPHGFVLCETGHEAAGSASAASVRARDHFQAMAVGVGEIDPAAAIVVIDLAGAAAHRIGPMVPPTNVFYQMKSRDTFAPVGPYIVTADEIKDPHKLQVRLTNNGVVMQNFNTDDMAHKNSSLHRMGHFHPHAAARRHSRNRHQSSRA